MNKFILFVGVAVAHYAAHFLAWAYNVKIALQILSFPALPLMNTYTLEYFEVICIMNSVIWAGVIVLLARRWSHD